jgi:hypothetical protein
MLSVRNLDEKQKPDVGLERFRRGLALSPGWNGTLPGATSVPHDDRRLIFKNRQMFRRGKVLEASAQVENFVLSGTVAGVHDPAACRSAVRKGLPFRLISKPIPRLRRR